MPPLEGPRAMLWVTRQPMKFRTEPSSIVVGIETSTDFLHWPRTLTRSSSISKASATFCNWRCAIWKGLSMTGGLLYPEGHAGPARLAAELRPGGDPDLVAAGRQDIAGGAAAGQAEAVGARKQVARVRKRAEIGASGGVQENVQAGDG